MSSDLVIVAAVRRSHEDSEPVFFYNAQQLDSHAARFFGARLPTIHCASAGIDLAREYWLADVVFIAYLVDLLRAIRYRHSEAGVVEIPHGDLGDRVDL
jgi:hypothetical protein